MLIKSTNNKTCGLSVVLNGKMVQADLNQALIEKWEKQANKDLLSLVNTAWKDRRAARSKWTKTTNLLNGTLADVNTMTIAIKEGIEYQDFQVTIDSMIHINQDLNQ